jgi:hypothetical protein
VRATYDLVNHDQDARLGVLHGLEVAKDGTAQTRVHACVDVAIEARRLDIGLLWHQQEDVSLGCLGDEVELVQHGALDVLGGRVDDELRVDVNMRGALCQEVSESVVTAAASGSVPTREMGVEFKTLQRIEFTISSSPDRHTLVTRARRGPRWRPGSGFDSADVTVACTRPSVCSLTSRHRFRRLSTF